MSKRQRKGCNQVRVALIGPMRNKPDWNYPQFYEVEEAWIEQHPHDIVINPARNFDGDTTREFPEYMQASMEGVLSAQLVILLPEWEGSEGATHEVALARVTNKVFYEADYDGGDWWFAWIDPPKPDPRPATMFQATEGFEGLPIADSLICPDGAACTRHSINWHREKEGLPPVPLAESILGGYEPPRTKVLKGAIEAINGDRNNQYGPPTQDFQRTADLANAFGFRVGDEQLVSHHVAIFMELLKISRKRWSPGKMDHWLDTAGYTGCGWECVVEEGLADAQ